VSKQMTDFRRIGQNKKPIPIGKALNLRDSVFQNSKI
jgi:hypothetical protein